MPRAEQSGLFSVIPAGWLGRCLGRLDDVGTRGHLHAGGVPPVPLPVIVGWHRLARLGAYRCALAQEVRYDAILDGRTSSGSATPVGSKQPTGATQRRGRGGTQRDRRLFDVPPLRASASSAVTFLVTQGFNHSGTWIVALMCFKFATIVNDISTSSVHALHLLTCTLAQAPT